MEALKPCPFCGGTPRIGDKYEGAGQRPSMSYPEIVCDQCGVRTDFGKRGFHRMFTAWNARAESAELARLRAENERLRAALQRELARLQSIGRIQTHYEGCDGSQGHAICYAARLIREALNPQSSTPAPGAAAEPPPNPQAPTDPAVS